MVGMQFGIFQRDNGRSVQQSSPVDAEGVHDETGHTDSFAYHEIGGGEGCMGGEEEEEGAIEGLHCGGVVVVVVVIYLLAAKTVDAHQWQEFHAQALWRLLCSLSSIFGLSRCEIWP